MPRSTRSRDRLASTEPDRIGLYISGQLLTEDYYVFNKLAKGLLGTNNVDTNSRLCMSSAVAGYKATLGADAPPCSYEDLAHAQTVFIAGSNTAWAHPILMRRLEDAKRANPEQKWIVVDPRRTETAEAADLHLQILPGTDVALFNGMAHLLLWEGLADQRIHRRAHQRLRCAARRGAQLHAATDGAVVRHQGRGSCAGGALVRQAAHPTLSLYCQGLNQSTSGTDKNAALINLHLLTGQIGKPGAGPFSLTGQPNAMGGREVGGLANLLSRAPRPRRTRSTAPKSPRCGASMTCHRSPARARSRCSRPRPTVRSTCCGSSAPTPRNRCPIRRWCGARWSAARSSSCRRRMRRPRRRSYADLLLPATTWGEKDGTVTNSERRISRVRAAIDAPGEARHDWRIAVDVARRIEARRVPHGARCFPTTAPSRSGTSTAKARAAATSTSPACRTRSSNTPARSSGRLPTGATQGATRLYADGVFPTPDGRAQFSAATVRPTAEKRDAHYPFSLTTGRLRDQWHGASRTGTLGRLFGHASEPVVEMHPSDLARLRLNSGDLVTLKTRRGSVVLPAAASEKRGARAGLRGDALGQRVHGRAPA